MKLENLGENWGNNLNDYFIKTEEDNVFFSEIFSSE